MDKALGFASVLFAVIAAHFIYVAFSLETTVPTEAGDIANLQLMQIQSANLSIGIGAAIISAIFAVGAALKS